MNWYVHVIELLFLHVCIDLVLHVCMALCVCVCYRGVLSLYLHTSPLT